jgi:20S proteasome alpha/beta subunit
MTLIVAICLKEKRTGNESVVIFSDSQATAGPVSYSVHKIEEIFSEKGPPLAIAAGSGDMAMIKKAVDVSNSVLLTKAKEEWGGGTPSFEQFFEAVQDVENLLIDIFSEYEAREVEINLQFLLASVSPDGYASLYLFDERGVSQPIHDNPKFACIGSGFFLGGNLLLQQFYSPDLTLDEATFLGSYVINEVSIVDPSVGPFEGESCYFRLVDGDTAVGAITKRGLQSVKSEYRFRKKLLRYVWKQSNSFGSRELYSILRQTIKRQKKVKKNQN